MSKRAAPAVADRRGAARMAPAFGVTCRFDRAVSPDAPPHGLVWNLSRGGAGMLVAGRPLVGAVLSGELVAEAGGAAQAVLLRVVRVQPVPTGDFLIGGQFLRELTDAELAPFVDPDAVPIDL